MKFIDALTIDGTAKRSSDGALLVDAKAARTGIQMYLGADVGRPDMSTVRVYRPGSEVFHADSLRSFAHRPITNDHPTEPVTADNWKDHAVGSTADEVRAEGIYVRVPLMVSDGATIAAIESGKRELSCGYSCDLDFTAGVTPSGMAYDAMQKNIRINHIAVVDHGRAGSECRIGDSWGTSSVETINDNAPKEAKIMPKIITLGDGFPIDISDVNTAETVIFRLRDQVTKLTGDAAKLVTDHGTVVSAKDVEIGKLTADLADAKSKIPNAEAIDKLVQDRVTVIGLVRAVDASIKLDGSNADIKRRLVTAKLGDVAVKDASDDVVHGMFTAITKDVQPKAAPDGIQTVFDANRGTNVVNLADRGQSVYDKVIDTNWQRQPGTLPASA